MAAEEPDAPEGLSDNTLSVCEPVSKIAGTAVNNSAVSSVHRIYSENYEDHVRYARIRVGSTEAAQDVVQQAFANTLNAVEQGAQIDNVGGFVRRCVHNLCVNRRFREPAFSLEERLHEMTDKSTAASAELRERWREVESVIDRLPVNQRNVFLMAEIKGYSYKEMAESMDLSVGSVRQLLNRARNKIRARVDTDSDWFGASMPVVGIDRALGSSRSSFGSNVSDWARTKMSELQGWLGNMSQTCSDAALQNSYSLVAGLTVVALAMVSPAPPAEQNIDGVAPAANRVVISTPLPSQPHAASTSVPIDEAEPAPITIAPPPSGVADRSKAISQGHGSTDNSTVSRVVESDDNDAATVVTTVTGSEPGSEPVEEVVTDPEGSPNVGPPDVPNGEPGDQDNCPSNDDPGPCTPEGGESNPPEVEGCDTSEGPNTDPGPPNDDGSCDQDEAQGGFGSGSGGQTSPPESGDPPPKPPEKP